MTPQEEDDVEIPEYLKEMVARLMPQIESLVRRAILDDEPLDLDSAIFALKAF